MFMTTRNCVMAVSFAAVISGCATTQPIDEPASPVQAPAGTEAVSPPVEEAEAVTADTTDLDARDASFGAGYDSVVGSSESVGADTSVDLAETPEETVGATSVIEEPMKPTLQSVVMRNAIIYFDYDKSNIRMDAFEVLKAHADYLAANQNIKVRLEGHADERGTREYNLALGERRGKSAASYLVANGVSKYQIQVVSYGEERPLVEGHDEKAWSKNRRVEFVYK